MLGFFTADALGADMRELRTWVFWRAVAAEFLGMLLFIFVGLSAIIGKDKSGFKEENVAQELKVSLAFALAIATLVQSLGHVSGGHLNPAVTLGLLVSCQISALRCVFYVLAQMLGAVTASAIVNGYSHKDSLGVNKVNTWLSFDRTAEFYVNRWFHSDRVLTFWPSAVVDCVFQLNKVTAGQGFVIEFLATLQLVLCVIAVTDKRQASHVKGFAPLAIGLSVGLGHFAAVRSHTPYNSVEFLFVAAIFTKFMGS